MRGTVKVGGTKIPRGTHLPTGKGWRLEHGGRGHKASLLEWLSVKGVKLAIFRVY